MTDHLQKQIKEPVVLVGHSMGGFIAQEAYARFAKLVKGVALCFTTAAFAGGGRFARQFIADASGRWTRGAHHVRDRRRSPWGA